MLGVAAFGELANVYDDTEPQHPCLLMFNRRV